MNSFDKKILDAFSSETPDIKAQIVADCKNVEQVASPQFVADEKKSFAGVASSFFAYVRSLFGKPAFLKGAVAVACVMLFLVGMLVGNAIPDKITAPKVQTAVYIDVNPSIELSLSADNVVISCNANNDDAKIILGDMNLKGVELKTAINAIVGSMCLHGYLTVEENSLLVSVDNKNHETATQLVTQITDQVKEAFEKSDIKCAIIGQTVEASKEIKDRAEQMGISPGKIHLLDKIVAELSKSEEVAQDKIQELATMTIKELNHLYSTLVEGHKPPDDVVQGEANGFMNITEAIYKIFSSIKSLIGHMDEYNVVAYPTFRDHKLVYIVVLRQKQGDAVYKYQVDLKTGEITEIPSNGGQSADAGGNNPARAFFG